MGTYLLECTFVSAERVEAVRRVLASTNVSELHEDLDEIREELERRSVPALEALGPELKRLPFAAKSEPARLLAEAAIERHAAALVEAERLVNGEAPRESVHLAVLSAIQSLSAVQLDLVREEGHPIAPVSAPCPRPHWFDAWLFVATGCAELIPSARSTQVLPYWNSRKTWMTPAQLEHFAQAPERPARFADALRELRVRNLMLSDRGEPVLWLPEEGATDALEEDFAAHLPGFVELLAKMRGQARTAARERLVRVGWTAFVSDE